MLGGVGRAIRNDRPYPIYAAPSLARFGFRHPDFKVVGHELNICTIVMENPNRESVEWFRSPDHPIVIPRLGWQLSI